MGELPDERLLRDGWGKHTIFPVDLSRALKILPRRFHSLEATFCF
jgi:hypothetical protein